MKMQRFLYIIIFLSWTPALHSQKPKLVTSWYGKGVKHEQGHTVDGKKEGQWLFWRETGHLRIIHHYKNDKLEGVYRVFQEPPDSAWVWSYKQRRKFQETDRGQVLECEGFYRDDRMDSVWKFCDTLGRLRSMSHWKNGQLAGLYTYFYPNGMIKEMTNYRQGNKSGQYVAWDSIGRPLCTGFYASEYLKDSTWIFYHYFDDGAYAQMFTYDSGYYLNGPFELRDKNGSTMLKGNYLNGMLSGEVMIVNTDSQQVSVYHYTENRRHGAFITYYPGSEKVHISGFYTSGFRDSIWTTFDTEGNIVNQLLYENIPEVRADSLVENPERKAEFPGGQSALSAEFRENAEKSGFQLYEFENRNPTIADLTIEKDGTVSAVRLIQHSCWDKNTHECRSAFMEIFMSMDAWIPAIDRNNTVRSRQRVMIEHPQAIP